jgi:hypothetical protein
MPHYAQQKNNHRTTETKQTSDVTQIKQAYVPPFTMIHQALELNDRDLYPGKTVAIPSEFFKALMGFVITQGFFDERWYLETYPDVEAAIRSGNLSSPLEHYTKAGYYEGRSPGPCFVDQDWYERYYGDLSEALKDGTIADSTEHYHQNGYFEGGRLPLTSCPRLRAGGESWAPPDIKAGIPRNSKPSTFDVAVLRIFCSARRECVRDRNFYDRLPQLHFVRRHLDAKGGGAPS